jgi:hypothetical protein
VSILIILLFYCYYIVIIFLLLMIKNRLRRPNIRPSALQSPMSRHYRGAPSSQWIERRQAAGWAGHQNRAATPSAGRRRRRAPSTPRGASTRRQCWQAQSPLFLGRAARSPFQSSSSFRFKIPFSIPFQIQIVAPLKIRRNSTDCPKSMNQFC